MPLLSEGVIVRGGAPVVATKQHQITIRHRSCKYKARAATRNGRQMTVRLPERGASTANGQRLTTVKCVHNSQIVIGRPSRSRMAAEGGCLRSRLCEKAVNTSKTDSRADGLWNQQAKARIGQLSDNSICNAIWAAQAAYMADSGPVSGER